MGTMPTGHPQMGYRVPRTQPQELQAPTLRTCSPSIPITTTSISPMPETLLPEEATLPPSKGTTTSTLPESLRRDHLQTPTTRMASPSPQGSEALPRPLRHIMAHRADTVTQATTMATDSNNSSTSTQHQPTSSHFQRLLGSYPFSISSSNSPQPARSRTYHVCCTLKTIKQSNAEQICLLTVYSPLFLDCGISSRDTAIVWIDVSKPICSTATGATLHTRTAQ